jgi:hypothetical protein
VHAPQPSCICSVSTWRVLIVVALFTRYRLVDRRCTQNACNLVESRPRPSLPLDGCLRLELRSQCSLVSVTVAWPSRTFPRDPTGARHDALRCSPVTYRSVPGASDTLANSATGHTRTRPSALRRSSLTPPGATPLHPLSAVPQPAPLLTSCRSISCYVF